MPPDLPFPVRHYEPADREVVLGSRLPHWSQAGAVCFITWRTADSLPRAVQDRLAAEREAWLRACQRGPLAPRVDRRPGRGPRRQSGAQPDPLAERVGHVDDPTAELPPADDVAYRRFCRAGIEAALDRAAGACPLRDPVCAAVVADSLHHFDGDRYILFDYVVMPNHVHALAAFPDAESMRAQCESWKHFTARALNRHLGRAGRFWQADSFDHLVRSDAQFVKLRAYVADNPVVANLRPGDYLHYSRSLAAFEARPVPSRPLAERVDHVERHSP